MSDSGGASPRPHSGSLQRSPDSLVGFKGAASRQKGNGVDGRTREGKGQVGERGNGEGRGQWRTGAGIAPWLWGIDAPACVPNLYGHLSRPLYLSLHSVEQ